MTSKEKQLLSALVNGESIPDLVPTSRIEAYLKNCCLACGCDGLPAPISTTDALLYKLAEQLAGGSTGSGEAGGGEKTASGVYTPASDTQEIRITGLSFTPKLVYAGVDLTQAEITDGKSKFCGILLCPYMEFGMRTNAAGTGTAIDGFYILQEEKAPLEDDASLNYNGGVHFLNSGFAHYRAGWYWRAGVPIRWTAVG